MPEEQKSVLDAINEGLAELAGDEPVAPETPEDVETPEADAPEAQDEGETPAEDDAEGEQPAETETDAPKEGTTEPKKGTPEEKPALEKAMAEPLPKGTAVRTHERFQMLVGAVKERDAKIAALETRANEGDELIKTITSSGMGAEEFGMSIQYAKLVNSPRLEDKEAAWKILENEMRGLAPHIGRSLPGEDPLAAHPDLKQLVAEGKTTVELAREVAQHRARTGASQKLSQAEQDAQRQAQEGQQAWEQGKAALTALGQELRASDPDYKRKEEIIKPNLAELLKDVSPARWAEVTRRTFANLKLPPVAAPAAPKAPSGPQPLRANKGAPGAPGAGPPKTIGAAINAIDFSQIR